MKKVRVIVVLAAFMLMGLALTGCDDNDNGSPPTENTQPERQQDTNPTPRRHTPHNHDAPPPEPNPDGTFG